MATSPRLVGPFRDSAPPASAAEEPAGEAELGHALAVIHRLLPRLADLDHSEAVQHGLRQAAIKLEAALAAHLAWSERKRTTEIDGETLALIAAAISAVLGQPHRVVGVQRAPTSVAGVNAWAIEGRFQHYSSHKVR